ncbi:MAG: ABC transporter permease subunit, partial [Gemmatales bacterium]|nr:ABC transporter permease subunit [Gemmatales bacterium]MDW8174247.1 ABC transporter permease subunit [Gemmatales bacterium]
MRVLRCVQKMETRQRMRGKFVTALHYVVQTTTVDLLLVLALVGLLYGVVSFAQQWLFKYRPVAELEFTLWALLRYTLFSLMRGLLAYGLSLLFTLLVGYWAAKDRWAEMVLIPLLDILQSIPVLSFLPGLILGLSAAFPESNVGLELAAVLMIFTGQVWNMTFSYYYSLKCLPNDLQEAATAFRMGWWARYRYVELPFATLGLVWNSMMSMAGGWFFLMINESYRLGEKDFRLPGLGSCMSVAVERADFTAMSWAMLAMALMIVGLDQLIWRPIMVWAQKYRVQEGGSSLRVSSWFLEWLRHSRLLRTLMWSVRRLWSWRVDKCRSVLVSVGFSKAFKRSVWALSRLALVGLVSLFAYTAWHLGMLIADISWDTWLFLLSAAVLTLGRVLATVVLATLWTLPAGLAIGLSRRLVSWLQPLVQLAASFPAPMLFPLVLALFRWAGVSLEWGSILLMLLGSQWYILF